MAFQFTQTGSEIQDILNLAQLKIAAPYDSGTSYVKGDYCTHEDGFFVANASTTGTWNASKWTAVTVGDVLEQAVADISALNATSTQLSNALNPYSWSLATRNSNYSGGTCVFIKFGKIVLGEIYDLGTASDQSTHGSVVFSGLPVPHANALFHIANLGTDVRVARLATNLNGEIVIHYSNIYASRTYYGSFWYIAS